MAAPLRALLDELAGELARSSRLDDDVRGDARREMRVLAAAVVGCTTADLARALDASAPAVTPWTARLADAEPAIRAAATRRAHGEPLAYAVGTASFRHLTLQVDNRVLIPRPETELLVDAVLARCQSPGGTAIDIGTGSGAIALALATEGRFDRVIGTDISADAIAVATANRDHVQPATPVEFRIGADLAPVSDVQARVIVSNPPYIAYEEASALPSSVRDWEPATALFAADRGMARYAVLLSQSAERLTPDGFVALEVDARRARETAALAEARGWINVQLLRDLSGRERMLLAQRSATVADLTSFPDQRPGTHA
ncbi:MAG: peptide chain release factor N(5)-glutamine methyltransferase [Gemmatimonadaceae bacterium]|nr:peptide chain release factor N(5)-glutamine methyltransferase [Gemmatimonadaceae bacterium]MCC6430606.1 peptide chain release factor N(5)-glutamine methyltransferase [Gemmatimonadaceae bacterium]